MKYAVMAGSGIFLTAQQAIELLPEGEQVHTFINSPLALVGADLDRDEVIDKIQRSDYREITGSVSRGFNHGLAVYNQDQTQMDVQMDVLFVETDMKKLDALYPEEDGER